MTRHEKITMTGLVLFLTGLVVTGLHGSFTIVSALLSLAGLATGSVMFLPRVSRNLRLYVNMGLYAVFFVASLVFFFLIVQRHPWTLDATHNRVFSLSADTKNFLRQRLAQPIRVNAFVSSQDRRSAAQLLDEYARYSPYFTYQVLDPFHDFAEANRFGLQVMPGDVFVEKLTTGTKAGLLGGAEQRTERVTKLTKLTEEELTNGIVQLLNGRDTVLYFLTGHQEYPLEETKAQAQLAGKKSVSENLTWLAGQLQRNLIRTVPLNLDAVPQVPGDATAVVLAGPRLDITESEQRALRNYLDHGGPGGSGGRLLVMLDPNIPVGGDVQTPLRRLTELLEDYGISLPSEIVVLTDKGAQGVGGDKSMIPVEREKHKIAKLDPDQPLLFRYARPVTASRVRQPNSFVDVLLKSPEESNALPTQEISKALQKGEANARFSPAEQKKGAQDLAVAATFQQPGSGEDQATRIVAVGNARFLTSDIVDQNGWLLFINSINWLSNQGDMISIPSRDIENTPVTLTEPQKRFLFLLLVIILPTGVGLGGLGYTLSRRELQ